MRTALQRLEGSFALAVLHQGDPGVVVGAKRDLPLVAGRAEGENFVASDFAAFLDHTKDGVILEDDQVVVVTPERLDVTDLDGNPVEPYEHHVDWDLSAAEKGGYEHFMLKEMHEQPLAIKQTLEGRTDPAGRLLLDELRMSEDELREVDKVFVVACGTAYHSGLVAKYAIEHWTRLPVEIEIASEFRYRDPVLDRNTLVIAISQSGETADTLGAVRYARRPAGPGADRLQHRRGVDPAGVGRGPLHPGRARGVRGRDQDLRHPAGRHVPGRPLPGPGAGDDVHRRGGLGGPRAGAGPGQGRALPGARPTRSARSPSEYKDAHDWLFLGRHVGYPMALEGALKLKEISYLHAEGYPAAELKHGPIALIEDGTPVVVVHPSSHVYAKMLTNIQEVAARGAAIIAIAEDGDREVAAHATHVLRVPADRPAAVPAGLPDPPAAALLPRGHGPRVPDRQAPQPGQERDGGVARWPTTSIPTRRSASSPSSCSSTPPSSASRCCRA